MQLQIIDRTSGKLWFVIQHLKKITDAGIKLQIPSDTHQKYRPLWDILAPNVNVAPAASSEVKLVFIDKREQVHGADSDCLYFTVGKVDGGGDAGFIPVCEKDGMPDSSDVLDMLWRKFTMHDFVSRRLLISAGPTAEDIDPVRFLTNRSSGKMGIALARAAYIRGAEVMLVCGPSSVRVPAYLNCVRVRSAAEMYQALDELITNSDIFISSAAVADYTLGEQSVHKIKKGRGNLKLSLRRTTDILSALKEKKQAGQLFVGFSVETQHLYKNSLEKLHRKGLDIIIANDPGEEGAGFASETNRVLIISNKESKQLSLMSKFETSNHILDYIENYAKYS